MQSSISKYRITKRVGGGSFGDIYLGVGANGEKVAVKFEKHGARCPQLRHEYKVYRELQNAPGFAKVHYFGTQDSYNLMVMDLLGPSLEDQFNKCGRRFSLKTVLMIADQMLERVELMHSRHLIHRDIKPANFVTDAVAALETSSTALTLVSPSDTATHVRCSTFPKEKAVLSPELPVTLPLITIWESNNPDVTISNLSATSLSTFSRGDCLGKALRQRAPPRSTSSSWRRSRASPSPLSARAVLLSSPST